MGNSLTLVTVKAEEVLKTFKKITIRKAAVGVKEAGRSLYVRVKAAVSSIATTTRALQGVLQYISIHYSVNAVH